MRKAPEAFRTISEAADALDTPAHVLRFWESKFSQVKPVKRAGGRRYYRPADIDLLSGIKLLLHEQGMTIRGVQKLLQEKGARHVAAMAPLATDMLDADVLPMLRVVSDSTKNAASDNGPTTQTDADIPALAGSATDVNEPAKTSATPEPEVPNPAEAADDASEAGQADAKIDPPVEPVSEQTEPDDSATPDDTDAPDDGPAPALAALLDAAATDQPAGPPLRFAKIAHALRTAPPQNARTYGPALARLEVLVEKLNARAG